MNYKRILISEAEKKRILGMHNNRKKNPTTNNFLFETEKKTGCIEGDCENGKGTYTWPDGSKYEGEFKGGEINGKGTYTFENGANWEGQWKDGDGDGPGTITYSDKTQAVVTFEKIGGEKLETKDNAEQNQTGGNTQKGTF